MDQRIGGIGLAGLHHTDRIHLILTCILVMGVATPFSALVLLLRMHFVTFANPRQMHAILEMR